MNMRHTGARISRPSGVFAEAVGMVSIAAIALAVLSASAGSRTPMMSSIEPPPVDEERSSAGAGYVVAGSARSISDDFDDAQTSSSGRWRVQGRVMPAGTAQRDEPVADLTDCSGDVNADGRADVDDVLFIVQQWGMCPTPCPADLDGDGVVNGCDLALALHASQN